MLRSRAAPTGPSPPLPLCPPLCLQAVPHHPSLWRDAGCSQHRAGHGAAIPPEGTKCHHMECPRTFRAPQPGAFSIIATVQALLQKTADVPAVPPCLFGAFRCSWGCEQPSQQILAPPAPVTPQEAPALEKGSQLPEIHKNFNPLQFPGISPSPSCCRSVWGSWTSPCGDHTVNIQCG